MSAGNLSPAANLASDAMPWWRSGFLWMILAGPAVVVVASFITLGLAIMIPDPVLPQDNSISGLTPAQQARNHAATGIKAQKRDPGASRLDAAKP
jgi:uncharacterized protein